MMASSLEWARRNTPEYSASQAKRRAKDVNKIVNRMRRIRTGAQEVVKNSRISGIFPRSPPLPDRHQIDNGNAVRLNDDSCIDGLFVLCSSVSTNRETDHEPVWWMSLRCCAV
jgi:hypothetical protein